jgi:HD-like signal output (HDOD) protein
MNSTTATLIARLEEARAQQSLSLPSLPDVVWAIRAAMADERKGIPHIAKLLQTDPMLAARVLKIVNSPLYFTGQSISDIKIAIQVLGLTTTRNIVTCLAMHNVFNVHSFAMRQRIKQLWQHSCHVAAITHVLAKALRGMAADKALLAGLLHDIGVLPILVFADNFPDLYRDATSLNQVIEQFRARLGHEILQAWNLDKDILEVPNMADNYLRDHEGVVDYSDLVIVAQLHSAFGQPQQQQYPPLHSLPVFNKLSMCKLGPEASLELIHQANSDIQNTVRMLSAQG